jgi:hypothetical protein
MARAVNILNPGGQMRFSATGGMYATPRLQSNIKNKKYPGYSNGYSIYYFADTEFGVPYIPTDMAGNQLNINWEDMYWYIFVK